MTRVTAARGPQLRCRGWRQEGLLRMLENVLEVGEDPDRLVVYAALGQAARDWDAYDQLVASLTELGDDETLVVQSGKPIGVFPSRPDAPLVVMACTNLVGRWATEHHFYELVDRGLTMWGGLTAGDWQYIGAQGVLQGVYELLGAIGREHFDSSLAGRLVVTAGLGGMGSAQPTAIRMTGAVGLIAEADPVKLSRAADRGALDETHDDLDAALARCAAAVRDGGPLVVGVAANAADVCAALVERGVTPDVVTDLTAAHDLRHGYLPQGLDVDAWRRLRAEDPHEVERRARASICAHVGALLALKARGAVVVENGNNLRAQAHEGGVVDAYEIDQFSARYIRPLFCDGIGPFRWVALSGDHDDLALLDDLAAAQFADQPRVVEWLRLARAHVAVQGLPARNCWLGHGERSAFALAVNAAVADGRLTAPVLFTRDHFDAGAMTHPRIGTEAMLDGSDAIADWPLLDALLLASTGADLVAIHAGGGGYTGYMQSAGVTIVADGTDAAAGRLVRTLDADTGLGVLRYADAGYDRAADTARRAGLGLRRPSTHGTRHAS